MARTARLLLLAAVVVALPATALAQGLLVPTETQLPALPLKLQVVNVEIRDGAAVTAIDQRFTNPTGRPLEATYIFPVPKGAAVQEFALWINGQKTKGEVLEKERATQIYTDIVRRMADPGLLEYLGQDLFRARVFPVPPAGEQRIEIKYSQVLPYDGGVYHLRYPLGASKNDRRPLTKERFVFTAKIASQIPIKSVYSPTHRVSVARRSDREAIVGFEPSGVAEPGHDLDLYYTVSPQDVGISLLTYRDGGDEPGYFMALVSPKQEWQAQESMHKRVTFVIDTSGSMTGDKMPRAKEALKYCLSRLQPTDRFNVIRFSTDVEALYPATVDASSSNVEKAQSFVRSMEPLGGTAIDEAVRRALSDGAGAWVGPHIVIFITDGEPTVGETDEARIVANARAANAGGSRVFTFGVGAELNARLLDALAGDGRGVSEFARDGADFERKISGWYDKLSHPVLADLSLALGDVSAYDIYPRQLPDLFRGAQLVVLGRYRVPGKATVALRGSVAGEARSFSENREFPRDNRQADFLPRLWAVRKVGFLLDEMRRAGEKPELKGEVVALGKRFGIVTPYTSYLVVEDSPAVAQPTPRPDWRTDDRRRGGPPPPADSRPSPRAKREPAKGGDIDELFNSEFSAKSAPAETRAPTASPAAPAGGGWGRGSGTGGGGLGVTSGEAGVEVSKKLKEMKEGDKADAGGTRMAGGKTFIARGGGWRDTAVADGAKVLTVKYLSDAYFALLKVRPQLKDALALGDRVTVALPGGKAVEISPDRGVEKAAEVEAFLK